MKLTKDLFPLVGKEVTALGDCGIAKDRRIKGILLFEGNEFYLDTERWGIASINKNTIEIL